jgi:hypothetical protein
MRDEASYSYKPVRYGSRWVIEATNADGETNLMTCGVNPTETEVRERIRFLLLDDDKIDVNNGAARKYQS